MHMHFDRAEVERLLAHAKAAPEHWKPYEKGEAEAGLILVGDSGVYLMSNGTPGLFVPGGSKGQLVAYAAECNPVKLPFDDWWGNKRAGFGGDDGADLLPANFIENALKLQKGDVTLDVTPGRVAIVAPRAVRPKRRTPGRAR